MDNDEFNSGGGNAIANSGFGGSGSGGHGGGAFDGVGIFLWRPRNNQPAHNERMRWRRSKRHHNNQPAQDDERAAQ